MISAAIQKLRGDGVTAVLARGGAVSFAFTFVGYALTMGLQLELTRVLGVEQYGVYAYVVSWLAGLELFVLLGLDTALVRYVPEYAARGDWAHLRGVLRRSVQIVIPAGAAVGVLVVGGTWLLRERLGPDLVRTFWVSCAVLQLIALLGLNAGALRALKRVGLSVVPVSILRPLFLGVAVGGLFLEGIRVGSVQAMSLNFAAHALALALATWWLARALPRERLAQRPRYTTRAWLRVSLPLLFVREMRVLMDTVDILIVGAVLGTTEAGIYTIATRLAKLTTFGQRAGNLVTAPMIAELHALERRRDLQRSVTLASWASFLSSLVLGGALALGVDLALAAFGREFVAGRGVTLILVAGLVVNAWTGPVGNLLNMTGHQDENARIIVVTALLELVLIYPAARLWGTLGTAAVVSTLVAAKNLWTWWAVRARLGINSSIFPVPPPRPRGGGGAA